MQHGDFNTPHYQYHHHHLQNPSPNPNPNPNDPQPQGPLHPSYASAPPFAPNYSSMDYHNSSSSYAPYSQNPDSVPNIPPTAPSFVPNPNVQSFNTSPQPAPFPSIPHAPEQQVPYNPSTQQSSYYPPYDQHHSTPNYDLTPAIHLNPNPNSNPNSSFLGPYSASYGNLGSSMPHAYENPYESSVKFDHSGSYLDENLGSYGGYGVYGRSRSDLGSDLFEKRRPESGFSGLREDGLGENIYAYDGGKVEPYSARGTSSKSSTRSAFDDYGRSVSFSSGKDQVGSTKVVKAIPKVDMHQDVKNGVQKFRVKLLAEGGSQSSMDVLCQIGLDGIRMLDPSTSRMLRIYPLETVTRSEVTDSSIFTFWSKSSVDIEPRRIRLQSNSYTTNTILDIVTAATVQLKEMGGKESFRSKLPDSGMLSEQTTEKKKGFADWMNFVKPANEEKDHWVPDEAVTKCTACGTDFGAFVRKHHCRNCGDIFCDKCTNGRIALTADENAQPVRVCDRCMAEVTQRLSNAKESASKPAGLHSHEDLARKLQEEMDRNRKASSGLKSSDGSGRRTREVACPTCTVHLQVQVPSTGSETIECGVCQHPFLVSAR